MRIPRLSRPFALFVLTAVCGACSQQGQGEVCDPRAANNGSSDCQDGLVCLSPSQLAPGTIGSRCCPVDQANATGVCAVGTSGVLADSGAPNETGASPEPSDGAPADGDAMADAAAADDGANSLADATDDGVGE